MEKKRGFQHLIFADFLKWLLNYTGVSQEGETDVDGEGDRAVPVLARPLSKSIMRSKNIYIYNAFHLVLRSRDILKVPTSGCIGTQLSLTAFFCRFLDETLVH